MGAQAGIGYRILEARRMFNTDVILLGVVVIGLMAALADMLIRWATTHITRWSERSR
jgi:ABC-type nitrate/sulfonate/bicarbonate transport system permease component